MKAKYIKALIEKRNDKLSIISALHKKAIWELCCLINTMQSLFDLAIYWIEQWINASTFHMITASIK
jgi:hypothetical protein